MRLPFQLLSCLAILISGSGWATSFYEQPFTDTVKEAPVIAHGKVGSKYSDWAKGEEKRIYTYYELQVEETLKGKLDSPTITMRELGGEKDGVGMEVAGAAQFERGEDVVVLLGSEKNPDGSYSLRGLMMGKYSVYRDPQGTEYLSGPGLVGAPPSGNSQKDGETTGAKWTLDALRQVIKAQANPGSETRESGNSGGKQQLNSAASSPAPGHPQAAIPAPQLHNSSAEGELKVEGSSEGFLIWIGLGLGSLALIGFIWLIRARN